MKLRSGCRLRGQTVGEMGGYNTYVGGSVEKDGVVRVK